MTKEIIKKLPQNVRDYFSYRYENAQLERSRHDEIGSRHDLSDAYTSFHGRMIRVALKKQSYSEKERRAIAMCALWCDFKAKQLGSKLSWDDVPHHARPVSKIVN